MTLQIDNAGRIIIPKKIRERLHLRAGSTLILEESAEGLLLRPLKRRPSLVDEGGILVHAGQPLAPIDWSRAVEDVREERFQDVAGL